MRDLTQIGQGSICMDKDDGGNACGCNCICDPTVARTLDQTSSRYNDRSAFAGAMQMDSNVAMNSMFLAQAQNSLEQTPATTDQSMAAQTANLAALIAAAKA